MLAKILWYPNEGKGSEVEITDALNWNMQDTLEIKNNIATLALKNSWRVYVDVNDKITFTEGDLIKLYVKNSTDGDTLTENDLTISAIVREFVTARTGSATNIQIKAMDKSYVMLNRLWSNVCHVDTVFGSCIFDFLNI